MSETALVNSQLSLWQFNNETPTANLSRFTALAEKKNDAGFTTRVSLGLAKRKDIANLSGLKGKNNAQLLNRKVLEIKDELKVAMSKEIVGIQANDNFTGGKVTVTRSAKTGLRKINFMFEEVPAGSRGPSDEEIALAWNMSVEQVRIMRTRQQESVAQAEAELMQEIEAEAKAAEQQSQAQAEAQAQTPAA